MILLFVAVAVLIVVFVFMLVVTSFQYRLDMQQATFERLPAAFDGTRLLFITDIHRRTIPEKMIDRCIEAGGAELVLIGGDLREGNVPLSRIQSNINKLSRIAPIYMVYGNHDYDKDLRPLEVMLAEERVRLLVNEAVVLEQKDGSRIRLAGVDDPRTLRDRIESALSEPEDGTNLFTILLAHDPIIMNRLPEDAAVDLILSGHTHGGQVSLPRIGPILKRKTDSNYWRGWFDFSRREKTGPSITRLFVSCGFGTSGIPIRLMTAAELHIITLKVPNQS